MPKFAKMVWDGESLSIPEELGPFQSHHFLSTPLDNLIELSGRVCYDSCSVKKTRSSPDYHRHIQEVQHLSVQEHVNFTVLVPRWKYQSSQEYELLLLKSLVNRPGIFLRETSDGYRLTLNIRVINDWHKHNKFYNSSVSDWLKQQFQNISVELCPLATFDVIKSNEKVVEKVNSETDEEIWTSFLLNNISRACTHELVRHKYMTGVSQRSSRFVDEHESDWSWHPLIEMWEKNGGDATLLRESEHLSKKAYKECLLGLEEFIKSRGVDKFNARKQARGAARGVLGNALSTELIFSASLAQWKWIIELRASDPADAEIRTMTVEVFNSLKEKFPDRFIGWKVAPATDGIGEIVIKPEMKNV